MMDTTAFKQRMQNLKSYRENNPGKGYWDWKVDAFQDGGANDIDPENNSEDGGYKISKKSRVNRFNALDPTMRFSPETLLFDNMASNNGEENKYWQTYLGLGNEVPDMSKGAETGWDNYIEERKKDEGQPASDFFGTTPRMDLNLQAAADTLMLGKINRNYEDYSKTYKNLPSKKSIEKAYIKAKEVLDNPNQWIYMNSDDYIIRRNPEGEYERNPLGMLLRYGMKWDDQKKQLRIHDTYDFPWRAKFFGGVPERPREMKIRSVINFDPTKGSVILRDSTNYNSNFPKVYSKADGGEIGDPDMEKFYQATGRSRSGRPLEEGLKPAVTPEDILSFTPLGDIMAVADIADAVDQKDWTGAGLAALGILPFVPNLYRSIGSKVRREIPTVRRTFQEKVNANDLERERQRKNRNKITEEYIDQRNRTYELANTPEARRRATEIDRKYGTDYNKVYDELTGEYEDINQYVNLPDPNFAPDKSAFATINPSESKRINLSTDNIQTAQDYPRGLIRHELGHYVDEKAYPGGINENAYLKQLGKPSKYVPLSEFENGFSDKSKAKRLYEYFTKPTEKKSIMNQFDEYLMENYTPLTYPSNTKQFRNAIESAPDEFLNMKYLLRLHKKPGILYKDFLNRPLVNNQNKTANKETQKV